MKPSRFVLAVVACVFASACGGGGSKGSSGGPAIESDFAAGELVGRAAVTSPPVTTNSASVTAVGLKGQFSSLKLRELKPSLEEVRIYYNSETSNGASIYSAAFDGSDVVRLTDPGPNGTTFDQRPQVSVNGKVVFTRFEPFAPFSNIMMMNSDGTGLTPLTTGNNQYFDPIWSPDGTKVAYLAAGAGIRLINVNTMVTTPVATDTLVDGPIVFSPDGSRIFYRQGLDIHAVPVTGGISAIVASGNLNLLDFDVAPSGNEIAFLDGDFDNMQVVRQGLGPFQGATESWSVNEFAGDIAYSPDGTHFLIGENTAPEAPHIFSYRVDGTEKKAITTGPVGAYGADYGPFVRERVLIAGGGGTLGTSAAGLIYGMAGSATRSALTFEATTPSSVVLTQQSGLNTTGPNLIFSADADVIPKMAFANGPSWRGTRVIGSGTPVLSANGALITLDSSTGAVVAILPFLGTRAASDRPVLTYANGKQTFAGKFLAAYDENGKNLAPNGATHVTYDSASRILSAN